MEIVDEHVAVVVVTFNSSAVIRGLLLSLDAGFDGISWRLYVADNGSTDEVVKIIRAIVPEATIVELGENRGYAAGINAAVALASSFTAVLVLNPDVRLGVGSMVPLLGVLRTPRTGIVVPRLIDRNSKLILSMRREPTLLRAFGDLVLGATRAGRFRPLGEIVSDTQCYERESVADWAEGSTQLFSSECWRRCGAWDESYFLYSEETEFDLRARDEGYLLRFVPSAVATHLEGGSSSNPGLWALVAMNRVKLFRSRNGGFKSALFWFVTLLREGTRAVLGRKTSRAAVRALTSPTRMREERGRESVIA
jgi:N-acetylglucosaminyl-diphospho-decaprenol L-rhamnosyltransferase